MKHLYDRDNGTLTDHGKKVGANIGRKVAKLVQSYLKRGYDPIELEHLITHETAFNITMEKLRLMTRKAK